MTRKTLGLWALAGAMALLCVPADAQGPIRIGASLSLTGTYAKLGKNQHEGYQLCIKDLNAKGGAARPQGRVRRLRRPVHAGHRGPALREAHHRGQGRRRDGAVLVADHRGRRQRHREVQEDHGGAAGRDHVDLQKGRKYIFMVISPAEVYLEGLVDMAAKRGLKTVAVVNEDTLFSKAAAAGAVELAKKKGMQVVFTEAYPKGNTDFSAMLTKIKAANPDVDRRRHLLRRRGGAHPPDEGAERQPQDVRGDGGRRPAGVLRHAQAERRVHLRRHAVGADACRTPATRSSSRPTRRSSATSRRITRRPATPAASSTREAVKRANSLDADKVREQLLKLETKTMFGDYKVDQDGFQLAHKMVTFQWQDEKKVTCGRTSWPRPRRASRRRPGPSAERSPPRRERRRHAGDGRAGAHLRRPVRRALRDGGAGAGPHLTG